MKKLLSTLLAALFLLSLTACSRWNGEPNPEALDLTLVGKDSRFSDFEVREGFVWLECELTLENRTAEPISGCLEAWFAGDVGTLVKEKRLPGLPASEAEALNAEALPAPAVLEFEPGRTTLRVVFIGTFAGDGHKQDRLLPQLYWTRSGSGGEIVLPTQ